MQRREVAGQLRDGWGGRGAPGLLLPRVTTGSCWVAVQVGRPMRRLTGSAASASDARASGPSLRQFSQGGLRSRLNPAPAHTLLLSRNDTDQTPCRSTEILTKG